MKRAAIVFVASLLALASIAQETRQEGAAPPKSTPVLSPLARLQAAKSVLVKRIDGSSIPVDTVITTLEGWGRYTVLNAIPNGAEKPADLVIEVSSPSDADNSVSVTSSAGTSRTGSYENSTKSSRELSSGGGTVRVVVRDARTNTTLWGSSEQVKGALKKNARENNLVEAAQKLVRKFRERVEPIKPE